MYNHVSLTPTRGRALATFYYTGKRTLKNYALLSIFRDMFVTNTKLGETQKSYQVLIEEFWSKSLGLTITSWLGEEQTP